MAAGSKDQQFEEGFVDHMLRSHGASEVTNVVAYKGYTKSDNHVSIAQTSWSGFTAFLVHLEKAGRCKLKTQDGMYYITMVQPGSSPNKRKAVDEQIERASKSLRRLQKAQASKPSQPGELHKVEKVSFSFGGNGGARKVTPAAIFQGGEPAATANKNNNKQIKKPTSALDEIIQEQEREKEKERQSRRPNWLEIGLIVRISARSRGLERYQGRQGVVEDLRHGSRADVKLQNGKRLYGLHQDELQTVIPRTGELVRIINGDYRGLNARIVSKDSASGSAEVEFESGKHKGRIVSGIPFHDLCLHSLEEVGAPRFRDHRHTKGMEQAFSSLKPHVQYLKQLEKL